MISVFAMKVSEDQTVNLNLALKNVIIKAHVQEMGSVFVKKVIQVVIVAREFA